MTVKELIEALSKLEQDRKVCYGYWDEASGRNVWLPVSCATHGVNELDCFVILDDYLDDEV